MAKQRTYLAIDLKSYYASAECCARHLDPLTTNLVVADASRTEKTICLAVSPSLKAYGIPGRARLFEVMQKVKEVNAQRLGKLSGHAELCIRMGIPPLPLLPMTRPLSPIRPSQSITLLHRPEWRTMKRYPARSMAST